MFQLIVFRIPLQSRVPERGPIHEDLYDKVSGWLWYDWISGCKVRLINNVSRGGSQNIVLYILYIIMNYYIVHWQHIYYFLGTESSRAEIKIIQLERWWYQTTAGGITPSTEARDSTSRVLSPEATSFRNWAICPLPSALGSSVDQGKKIIPKKWHTH